MNGSRGSPRAGQTAIAMWLLVCAALVFAMVVLGGATRLTHSGLSMVDWRPITGFLPPLHEAEWQRVFARYQAYPEYQKINVGMTLSEFKNIFWFEYSHRLLGRLIGIVFLVPFVYFAARRQISRPLYPKLILMFVLGG
ncbi:MAG: COX15/CtaA family protein, partial [Rhodospirillales bacterium]|nr:COX15/CtaA family protein [Rhodospirillales bacterium]